MRLPGGFRKDHEYVELSDFDHQGSGVSQNYPDMPEQPWYKQLSLQTWQPVVWSGVLTSAVVLIANLAVLFTGLQDPVDGHWTRVLFRGSCQRSSTTYTAWHILINILSTLLLSASNAASQILAAPTRAEVDVAHAKGSFIHIGVFDFLNLRFITLKRIVLCGLIAISSIPLHLLYNSAIFNTTTIYLYYAIMVSPEFVNGGPYTFNVSATYDYGNGTVLHYYEWYYSNLPTGPDFDNYGDSRNPEIENDIQELQQQARNGSLLRLDNRECILQFGIDTVSNSSAVLVVTKESAIPANQTLLATFKYSLPREMVDSEPTDTAFQWVCNGAGNCNGAEQAKSSDQWMLDSNFPNVQNPTNPGHYTVDHCLVRPAPQECAVDLSITLMVTVIVCNIIKLCCFLLCLSIKEHEPLVTLGDAVCSFLSHPDPASVGLGPVSSEDIRHGIWDVHRAAVALAQQRLPGQKLVFPGKAWKNDRRKYFAAVGVGRWISTGIISGIIFATGFALLLVGMTNKGWGVQALSSKFNFTSRDVLGGSYNLFSAVFTANIFQLAISNAYLLYNGVFTCVLLSAELADYATESKTMRVTRPRAGQRSTYWLQLPYRWSLPLMGAMTLLHWLVSEALYMVDVTVLGPDGHPLPASPYFGDQSFYGLAWGPLASLLAVIEGGLMIVFIFANGFRKFPAGIPILSSSSIAIAAACRPAKAEFDDVAVRRLRYGVLETDADRDPKPTGFSARAVAPLKDGEYYGGEPDVDDDDEFNQDGEEVDVKAPSPLLKGQASSVSTASEARSWGGQVGVDDNGQSRTRSRPGRAVAAVHKFT